MSLIHLNIKIVIPQYFINLIKQLDIYLKKRYPFENQISTNVGILLYGSIFSYYAKLFVSNDPIEFTYLEKACSEFLIGSMAFMFGGTLGAIIGFYTKIFGVLILPILIYFLKNKLIFTFGQK